MDDKLRLFLYFAMRNVDGGCSTCAEDVAFAFLRLYPKHQHEVACLYTGIYGEPLASNMDDSRDYTPPPAG